MHAGTECVPSETALECMPTGIVCPYARGPGPEIGYRGRHLK